ncbi:hypothetical protein [Candidatus Mycoplasma haematohominis]|uniref:Uncharacterized protein n=1 Tax=Candidatus Mycoplasma haematohominis TaxID=1494318 RepID=A0A478FS64_9MOLU|nr:hypothetical protein [Candidatus Mycoplasma haemohominis]GCE63914.1 hypothetical protein MHSWG343_09210 [Candidatus Mycoplasma haemohominis]
MTSAAKALVGASAIGATGATGFYINEKSKNFGFRDYVKDFLNREHTSIDGSKLETRKSESNNKEHFTDQILYLLIHNQDWKRVWPNKTESPIDPAKLSQIRDSLLPDVMRWCQEFETKEDRQEIKVQNENDSYNYKSDEEMYLAVCTSVESSRSKN